MSDGLDSKFMGMSGSGVVRGATLQTAGSGLNVNLVVDPVHGDSIYSYVDSANGRVIHFRDSGGRTLDLTPAASSTVYVALYVNYTTGSDTVVEFRTYSEAELFGGSPVAEAGDVVIVGSVVVPASGPISASAVTPSRRREAWSDESLGLRPWTNIVVNGDFELGGQTDALWAGSAEDIIPGFRYLTSTGTVVAEASTSAPRTGLWAMRWAVASGTATGTLSPRGVSGSPGALGTTAQPVRSGQLLYASFYLSGTDVPANTATPASLTVIFYDETGTPIGTSSIAADPTTETGTFAYTKIEGTLTAPGDGYVAWALSFEFDAAASPTSELMVDDVVVLLQPPDEPRLTPMDTRFSQLRTPALALDSADYTADADERHEHTVELASEYTSGAGATVIRMRQLDGTMFDFYPEANLHLADAAHVFDGTIDWQGRSANLIRRQQLGSWEQVGSAGATQKNGSAWGADVVLLVGASAALYTSDDGESWTSRTAASAYAGTFQDVIYSQVNSKFLAVGSGGEIPSSADGHTWPQESTGGNDFFAITENGTTLVAVGASGRIETSTDGSTWTARTAAGAYAGSFVGACWNGSVFAILGNDGEVQTSPGGTTWTSQGALSAASGDDIEADSVTGTIIANAGSGTSLFRSVNDGVSFSTKTLATIPLNDIYQDNGLWITFLTGTGEMASSIDDGQTWRHHETQLAHGLRTIVYAGGAPATGTVEHVADRFIAGATAGNVDATSFMF